jgi:small subunit ribosomal protein S1
MAVAMRTLKALPVRQPLGQPCQSVRPKLATSRLLVRKVAAIEEQQTAYEQQAEDVAAVAPAVEPEVEDLEQEVDELDASQEELIKWMLFLDTDAQEADLDEMVDYEEYADDEYEQLFEDVEDIMAREDYDFKVGDKVMGTVYEVDENGAYVEIGAKTAGFVPLMECSLAKLKTVSTVPCDNCSRSDTL